MRLCTGGEGGTDAADSGKLSPKLLLTALVKFVAIFTCSDQALHKTRSTCRRVPGGGEGYSFNA